MKNLGYFIGWLLILESLLLAIPLNYETRDLEEKVALSFGLFLFGLFILIKTKK